MTIELRLFAPGLLLLLFPAEWLLSSMVQLRSLDRFQSLQNSPRDRPWWWVPALWLDPLRAFAGAYLLRAALGAPVDDWASTPKLEYSVVVAAVGVGVLCQMFTRRDPEAVLAPIGFVAGLVAALTPWQVAAIGVTMAVTAMLAFRRFHAFFTIGLCAVGALGFVLKAEVAWLVPALAALALPFAVSALSGRALEIPTRRDSV
jgi:hypothetical protein